ncbi:hypothetical protein GCK72_025116 [Caenorhabditis remanei]|uniref:Protein kinase domain-containing protein n=1 Tax=Caenorhabditis remanei TaxID=31234 RepID=A0A6A5G290_CAERE|nr:hypothetical protein GCK72_025116 [Caenorhabditis remanei]KAF1748649.1 hypothetical protein GCK72_025116 [Caenorhabditis remanei]
MVSAARKKKNRINHRINLKTRKQQAWEQLPESFIAKCRTKVPFTEPEGIEDGSKEEKRSMDFFSAPTLPHFNPEWISKPYSFSDQYSIHATLGRYNLCRSFRNPKTLLIFRTVMKGWHESGCIVAMKKFHVPPEDILQLEEVRALSSINHENVVKLLSLRLTVSVQYLVLEYCHFDLEVLIHLPKVKIETEHIKSIAFALLSGLTAIHKKNYAHRNLRPSHVLLTQDGVVKITDFGLSCSTEAASPISTSQMENIHYAAPESLLGCTEIRRNADLWSVGVIIGELFLRASLFDAKNNRNQVVHLLELLGDFEGTFFEGNQNYQEIRSAWSGDKNGTFHKVFEPRLCNGSLYDGEGLRFVKNMMKTNIDHRLTVEEALNHEWFKSGVRGNVKDLLEIFKNPCRSRIFQDSNDDSND